jgi:hypothetical protein
LRSAERAVRAVAAASLAGGVVACEAASHVAAASAPASARVPRAAWHGDGHVRGVVDLSSPRVDGSVLVAAAGRLLVRSPDGGVRAFAPAYSAPPGLEPYIVLSSGLRVAGAGCRFAPHALHALRLAGGDGITEIAPSGGRVRRFAALPGRGLENGIAFDQTGRFGHRLLVTASVSGRTTVFAIDCRGHVTVLTRSAPRVEGGVAVAPASFGRFGGDLIAPDELSGRLYAIAPGGSVRQFAVSPTPHGQDVGVESEGFLPRRFGAALVADRLTRRNRHPGDDLILSLSRSALRAGGARSGDLLVVDEGGAATIAVSCKASACHVHRIADGPPEAHIEGHVVFTHP